uniref:ubiquitinyl hydrolase 1 n=1 Tax=Ficedula albicollis TaxID=59894 RepID=A0A803V203_FICAL
MVTLLPQHWVPSSVLPLWKVVAVPTCHQTLASRCPHGDRGSGDISPCPSLRALQLSGAGVPCARAGGTPGSTAAPWTSASSSTPRRNRYGHPGRCPRPAHHWHRGCWCLWCWACLWRWWRVVAVTWCPQLAPDDAWRCPHCKVPQQGTVKLSLWTLPEILIIHLKRFRQVAEQRHKLTTLVRFPLRGLDMPSLRLPPGCPREHLYDLYAVCNHHGSMQGGHYTGERGRWGRGHVEPSQGVLTQRLPNGILAWGLLPEPHRSSSRSIPNQDHPYLGVSDLGSS